MIQPLRNRMKKRKVAFFGLMIDLQHRTISTGGPKTVLNTHNDSTENIETLCKQGLLNEALQILHLMDHCVNSSSYQCILHGCIEKRTLREGKITHAHMNMNGFVLDNFLLNTLLDMYAKCGIIEKARDVFDKMHKRDVVSWNTIIAGNAMHGYGKGALQLFDQMQNLGIKPNHVTLLGVLSACCHAGLVAEGRQYFDCMSQNYNVTPRMEHYVCMVDLLGRAGYLDEAEELISKMPTKPNATVWRCLLGACRIHNKTSLGAHIAECLFDLNPTDAAPYVLLSNIYAEAGRWGDTESVRRMMKDKRVKKSPGCSWIEVNKQVYVFFGGDS